MPTPDSGQSVYFPGCGGGLLFAGMKHLIEAHDVSEVAPALAEIDRWLDQGYYAAGFLCYEAAPGLDSCLTTHRHTEDSINPTRLPLVWMMITQQPEVLPLQAWIERFVPEQLAAGSQPVYDVGRFAPEIHRWEYMDAVERIRELIAAGDTYQVNYTFPMRAEFTGSPRAWFAHLLRSQPTEFSAYLDLGPWQILSLSPELFVQLDGGRLVTRPMKGTRPRGRWYEEDLAQEAGLRASEKDRAENVMIVDLMRNDMGRIARRGSVQVQRVLQTERHPTVWQMTSEVEARTDAPLSEIITAMFPCGSVTGAPKPRTMEIIRQQEPHPRGIYCGTIGWCAPDRQACFSVAIRTALVDTQLREATYHVGSGIVWDSIAAAEYDECLTKAALLRREVLEFELLETLRHDRDAGYTLLDEHIDRLTKSAAYFDFRVDPIAIRQALLAHPFPADNPSSRVRLLVDRFGEFRIESSPLPSPSTEPIKVALAASPIRQDDVFLYHKTTHRSVYQQAAESRPEAADVILFNDRGEVTESTIANIAVKLDGKWHTPPIESGLLPGTLRSDLLARGELQERVITIDELKTADGIRLLNSVRGMYDVELM